MTKSKRRFMEVKHANNAAFMHEYSHLKNIALSVFEWTGLPDTVSPRFLEESLYYYGICGFVNDKDLGYIALPAVCAGKLNMYREPVRYNVFSIGYSKTYALDEMVAIWNNYSRQPTVFDVEYYANRLYKMNLAIDTNVNAQKTPIIIETSDEQRLSAINAYEQYDGNYPVIFTNKGYDIPLRVLNTNAPFVADQIHELRVKIYSDALAFLGIATNINQKAERMLVSEVAANSEIVRMSNDVMLLTRQQAAEKISNMIGSEVTVKRRISDIDTLRDFDESAYYSVIAQLQNQNSDDVSQSGVIV